MALVDNRLDSGVRLSEATASDYVALLKPRVMSLVVFTAFVGMVAAPVHLNPMVAVTAILCIAVGAGASGALNMWYDADIDAMMRVKVIGFRAHGARPHDPPLAEPTPAALAHAAAVLGSVAPFDLTVI